MVQNFSRGLAPAQEKPSLGEPIIEVDERQNSRGSSNNVKVIQQPYEYELQKPRRVLELGTFAESLIDLVVTLAAVYFIVFGALVYMHRGRPVEDPFSSALLRASNYGPTIFPIFFSGIVARFLQVLAQAKLETGARVLTLEHLLRSRTVFSTFTAPILLGSFTVITPFLLVLWALSPLGGQASLRIISTSLNTTTIPTNFTYLSYVSPFSNEGQNSASASLLSAINGEFTAAIVSSTSARTAPQDTFGNVRIPVYDTLPQTSVLNGSNWRNVPESGVTWSSLTGIPVAGLNSSGNSTLTLSTGYMTSDCQVTANDTELLFYNLNNFTYTSGSGGWSGANFAVSASIVTYLGAPQASFVFYSVAVDDQGNSTLTTANCTVAMEYVDVQVQCSGTSCKSTAARPAATPASHIQPSLQSAAAKINMTNYTPLNGLGQTFTDVLSFWKNFVNATNPYIGCDTTECATSAIEGYLADPDNPFGTANTIISQGNANISTRLTQLINTYWINSVAPFSTAGDYTGPAANTSSILFNSDSNIGSTSTSREVIKCNNAWLAVLLVSSIVMLLAGILSGAMGMRRRGPDILDSFSALLRDNPHVPGGSGSSMDDGIYLAKRLENSIVRLGDVRPNHEVGHVALGTEGVAPLVSGKWYD